MDLHTSRWRWTRRTLIAGFVLFVAMFLTTPPASFAADPTAPVNTAGVHQLTITPAAWTIITGLILPFVIAAVTKATASSTLKAVVGVVLAFVAALVERATKSDGSAVFSTGLLIDVGLVYVPQLVSYLGVWKHFDLNGKVAPTVGLGPAQPATT